MNILCGLLQIFLENRVGEQETYSAFVGAYDLDSLDRLTLIEKTSINGTFLLTSVDPDISTEQYFACNATWVTYIVLQLNIECQIYKNTRMCFEYIPALTEQIIFMF